MNFKENEIIILLGAGASKDADIPTSVDMISKIEELLEANNEWKPYKSLYHYIKSAIYYAEGIGGKFGHTIQFNIERLVNTLSELEKKEVHTIYPFIGNWNIKLIEVAQSDFSKISKFKTMIITELRNKWILKRNYQQASYLGRFVQFNEKYTFPLRMFTLNYDLCLEKNCDPGILERGFDLDNRRWNWRLFLENTDPDIAIYLYKLHGSIDWERDSSGNLTFSDEAGSIDVDKLDIIFGTNYKLQYIDPYLFFAYEFRKYSLEAKLIVTIGYGFADEHINGMIGQALKSDPKRKMLCVLLVNEDQKEDKRQEIQSILKLNDINQVVLMNVTAKAFMEQELDIAKFEGLFLGEDAGSPF